MTTLIGFQKMSHKIMRPYVKTNAQFKITSEIFVHIMGEVSVSQFLAVLYNTKKIVL